MHRALTKFITEELKSKFPDIVSNVPSSTIYLLLLLCPQPLIHSKEKYVIVGPYVQIRANETES